MVSQLHWEDDIVWNGDDVKHKVISCRINVKKKRKKNHRHYVLPESKEMSISFVTQVMQKLNSKNNAAGWVPSSDSRTAQGFSQPGKGASVTVAPNVRLATSQITTPLHMQSQKNKM